jgi:hypothetical protein
MLVTIKVQEISIHLVLRICMETRDFSTGDHVFSAINCMEKKDIEFIFYNNLLLPSHSMNNFISKSEISSHNTISCLKEDNFLLEKPSPFFKGVNDIFIVDRPLEKHLEDIFRFIIGFHVPFTRLISSLFNSGLS